MDALNDYCLLHIFQYFTPTEKLAIEKVCARWQQLVQRLWKHISKLQFRDGQSFYKKKYDSISFGTLRELIHKCGKYVDHIDLENMIVMHEFLTVHFGTHTYRLLVSSFAVNDLMKILTECCNNLISVFLNTSIVQPDDLRKLVKFNRKLLRVKICGIDNKTTIDDYLEYLPDCLEKLDLFFVDCQLKDGLKTVSSFPTGVLMLNIHSKSLIQRSSNLKDLRCICYEASCECGLTEEISQVIGNYATHLNRLHLRQLDAIVSEDSMYFISALSNLEYLKLERFDNVITDNVISQITQNCQKLRFISFSGCPRISNVGIYLALSSLPKLEDLEIFHADVSELVPADVLVNILPLKRLYLTNCPNLTQDTICRVINASPNMKTLFISHCSLQKNTIAFAICTAIARNKSFVLKKWKALNALPFRVIVQKIENSIAYDRQWSDPDFRFLVYDNEGYDEPSISNNVNIALFLQSFVSNNLNNCRILQ